MNGIALIQGAQPIYQKSKIINLAVESKILKTESVRLTTESTVGYF
jgi:hypothetical protein